MSMIGTRVLRREDGPLLVGDARFVADLRFDQADDPAEAHVVFVRSVEAHAEVTAVHVDEAAAMPGVIGVFTAETIGLDPLPPIAPFFHESTIRHPLAHERIRFAGEAIAVVAAETPAQAHDAAELVWADVEPLPPVVGIAQARVSDVHLFPAAGSNVIAARAGKADGDVLEGADVVVQRTIVNQRMSAASIEPRVMAADWDGRRLTVDASTQGAFQLRDALVRTLGLDESQVRVRHADVGGGFGSKGGPLPEDYVVARLAMILGRRVRWFEERSSCMAAHGHSRAQLNDLSLGVTNDGRFVGLTGEVVQDAGAYPIVGAVLPRLTVMMGIGPYVIPRADLSWATVATTTAPVGAFRGAGRPEATYNIERLVDAAAYALDLDPVEIRRRNLIPADELPHTTVTGGAYDSGDYVAALDRVVEMVGYDQLRAEQARRREEGDTKLLGIGVSVYVEITAGGPTEEGIDVALRADGKVVIRTGSAPQGQGHLTTWAMLAADELGVSIDDVIVEMGDTDTMPPGPLVGGSRSVQSYGASIASASREFVSLAKDDVAATLEASVADIVFDPEAGRFHVSGSPAISVGWAEVAAERLDPLELSFQSEGHPGSFPFGAHAAVVEIDAETGAVDLVRFVAVDDCGTIINPMIVEGQVHGGISAGIGQALFEEFVYDESGTLLSGNFLTYGIGAASEYPSFERAAMETPSPNNVLGAKGIGESGTIGAMPAVVSAVIDAVRHLGVDDLDTPLTPERIWRAIDQARSAQ